MNYDLSPLALAFSEARSRFDRDFVGPIWRPPGRRLADLLIDPDDPYHCNECAEYDRTHCPKCGGEPQFTVVIESTPPTYEMVCQECNNKWEVPA